MVSAKAITVLILVLESTGTRNSLSVVANLGTDETVKETNVNTQGDETKEEGVHADEAGTFTEVVQADEAGEAAVMEEEEEEEEEEQDALHEVEEEQAAVTDARPAQAFLNYGFTTDVNRPNFLAETYPIFNLKDNAEVVNYPDVKTDMISTSSAKETSKKFAGRFGIHASYGWCFSAAASASTNSLSSSKYAKFRQDQLTRATMFQVTNTALYPHEHLTSDAKKFIETASIEDIVTKLGMFYADKITLGGVFQATFVKVAEQGHSQSDFEAEVKASGSYLLASAGMSASTSSSSSFSSKSSNITCTYIAKGGNSSLWLGLNAENKAAIQQKWAASVNADNLFPTGFKLRPMWTLLRGMGLNEKASKMEKYLMDEWSRDSRGLENSAFAPQAALTAPPLDIDVTLTNSASQRRLYAKAGKNWGEGVGAGYPPSDIGADGVWRITKRGDDYRIINKFSKRALYAQGRKNWGDGYGASSPPSEVYDDSVWRITKADYGWRIVNKHSNRALYAAEWQNWKDRVGAGWPATDVTSDGFWRIEEAR